MVPRARLASGPIVLVLVTTGVAYAADLGNPFFGSDTWPWLVSTRVTSPGDVLRVAFSPIMSGTRFVVEVARFYHPLTALTYSLDQALFGLNPFGFYATNLGLHLAAVWALYSLARALGASWWAGCACALVLGLHPIAAATVPSLPRRQDLVVGALLLGSMSLLARTGIGAARVRWGPLVGALGLFWLALGGKEIAYAGLLVVPIVGLAGGVPGADRAVTRSVAIVLGFALLEAVAFGGRWLVLGGLGGYYGSAAGPGGGSGWLEYFVRPYVTDVLWPFQSALPDRLRDWLLVLGLVALVVGAATAGFARHRQLMALIGVVWQAAFLGLYAAVHTSLSAYLLYVPLAGLGLLVGAVLDGAVDCIAARPRLGLRDVCAGLSGAAAAALLVGVFGTSALVTDYPEFRDAGSVSTQFIAQALGCLGAAPAGAVVNVDGLPHRIEYGSAASQFVDVYVFEPYSLESVVRLLAPDTRATVSVRSSQDVRARPERITVTCSPSGSPAGDQWQLQVQL